jgi:hypothetical protein
MGMSYDDEMRNSKKGKRGATNVGKRLDGLGQNGKQGGSATYIGVDAGFLYGIVVEITKRGGAVSFGLSRSQEAWNVTLFLDGDRRTVWINGGDDVNEKLEEIYYQLCAIG